MDSGLGQWAQLSPDTLILLSFASPSVPFSSLLSFFGLLSVWVVTPWSFAVNNFQDAAFFLLSFAFWDVVLLIPTAA